ncbi:MAG: rhomboid family intramembrane serine protease [Crocinitomicaceae bacterium]|nr:rhomboid family intramembrane serine protease [Crocinitomicaceae bacterium]
MSNNTQRFGSSLAAFFLAGTLVLAMWLVFWAQHLFRYDFYQLGVLPQTLSGLKGILFMPLIHDKFEIEHILNNSFATFFLTTALFYFYKEIALKVVFFGWLLTGLFLWMYAENNGAYHVGMSGVIYVLAGFLFTSGAIRHYMPLQAISLFVVFIYGSMIWGIFPMKAHVSWEGHFVGLIVGIALAYLYKSKGPQRPKYQYEIEKEMGIEPIDLEAIWNENQRMTEVQLEENERIAQERTTPQQIIYHFIPNQMKGDQADKTDP